MPFWLGVKVKIFLALFDGGYHLYLWAIVFCHCNTDLQVCDSLWSPVSYSTPTNFLEEYYSEPIHALDQLLKKIECY